MSAHDVDTKELLAQGVWLRRLARALTGDAHADDLLQETYAVALVSPPERGQPLRPWLAAVLRNFAHMMFRSESRRRARETSAHEGSAALPTPEELLASHQAQRLVADAVEAVDEPYRSTVLLCYVEGLAPTEVARRLGVPAGTVRWRLKRALELIRARLEARHGGRRELALVLAPLTGRRNRAGVGRPGRIGMVLKIAGSFALLGVMVVAWSARHGAPPPAPRALVLSAGTPGASPPRSPPTFRTMVAAVDPSGRIEGIVRDEAHRPIRGATVAALARIPIADVGTGRRALGPAAVAMTDERGHYRFEGLAPGNYGVTATAPGLAPGHVGAITIHPGAPVHADLVLSRNAVTQRGRVLDVGGGPVAAARVMALDFASGAADTTRIFVAVSDGRGEYRLSLGRRVRYGFAAEAGGYAQTRLDVESLEADRVRDIILKPAAQVTGRVIDAASAPVAGAMVRLARQDGTDIPFVVTAVTDDRGEFVLRGLVPSRYRLWARKGREAGRHPEALAVHDAEALSLVVSLERRPSVSGRVLSEAGQPVAGAELWFSWEEGTAAQEPQAVTDREGHYRIEGVLPGTYELRAVAPGFAPGRARIAVAEADLTAVDHRLATEARIHGRVLTSAGAPAPAVHVIALPARRPGPGEPMLLTARTLADGSYLFEGVQPGQFRIGAEDATFGIARAMTVWTLAPGEKKEVNLQLEPGAALSGRVRRADGSPAASVVVTAYQGPTGYAASSGRRAPAPTAPSWSGRWSTGKPAFWRRPQSWPRSLVAFPPGPRPSPSSWPTARTPATSS